jgi:hypothetical protein
MLLCIDFILNRKRIGQHKYKTKEERRNFNRGNLNRRSYSTYIPDIIKRIEEHRSTK